MYRWLHSIITNAISTYVHKHILAGRAYDQSKE
jgi:hypothetical protein